MCLQWHLSHTILKRTHGVHGAGSGKVGTPPPTYIEDPEAHTGSGPICNKAGRVKAEPRPRVNQPVIISDVMMLLKPVKVKHR